VPESVAGSPSSGHVTADLSSEGRDPSEPLRMRCCAPCATPPQSQLPLRHGKGKVRTRSTASQPGLLSVGKTRDRRAEFGWRGMGTCLYGSGDGVFVSPWIGISINSVGRARIRRPRRARNPATRPYDWRSATTGSAEPTLLTARDSSDSPIASRRSAARSSSPAPGGNGTLAALAPLTLRSRSPPREAPAAAARDVHAARCG
jgi:hypothetical protein